MAEPAAVIAIVNGLANTANICFQIIRRAYHAPDEIKNLNAEACNWRPQLESLAELLQGDSQSAHRLRQKLEDGGLPVQDANELITELNRILGQFQKPNLMQRFQWSVTTRDHVRDLLNQLQRDMGVILGNLQIETHLSVFGLQKEIRQIQVFETNEHERRNILQWLKPDGIDAREFHRRKRDLREEGTCNWLAKSGPWLDWCEGGSELNARFLWIHGLPGAGKTVLASFAIDEVAKMYLHKGVSYYYCSHERQKKGHTSSEEAISFLRWVIRDLTAQITRLKAGPSDQQAAIPKKLQDLYCKHDFGVDSLLECLLAVTEYIAKGLEFQQQVCIIVDAVDESPLPRNDFLRVLTTIGTDPDWQHVSLCFTSRKETDIAKAIEDIQPSRSSQPSRPATPQQRPILTPKRPSDRLRQRETAHVGMTMAGFDGGPSYGQDMPPPSPPRGRTPSGFSFESSHDSPRVSHSEVRRPPGDMASHQSGRLRSMSMSPADPMEIDSPGYSRFRVGREGCTILSMDDNPDVREAIRTFVRSQLQGKGSFRKSEHRRGTLEEVVDLIAKRAKGMFRWAACQVDIIIRSNLFDIDSVSEMLERIPPDIFGTYEHMITRLLPHGHGENEYNRNFARTALALICSPTSGVPCAKVLVEASRFHVPHGSADEFTLGHLEKILGCLITVTPLNRGPESIYNRSTEDPDAKKNVSVAHYTVKEYLFDKSTAAGTVKDFALSTESIQNLELQVIFSGLRQFGIYRKVREKLPTPYEEYCLKMTDRALKERRDLILRNKTVWKAVFDCLRWDSAHHLQDSGAFPNMKSRAEFPNWTKTSPFEPKKECKVSQTSVLVSLVLLQWPELAKVYLEDLSEATKREVWRDSFELAKNFKVEGTNPTSLIQLCVTRRDVAFLQVLIDSKADFSREKDLVMDLFYHAYGHKSLDDQDGGAKTSKILKMLLDRGVRPEAPGYIFTPLQFAVSNLEDRWVRDLLFEGADPNATGTRNGVHPFGDEQDSIQGHLTPLQICRETRPKWLQSDYDDSPMQHAIRTVEESLIQYGAQDPVVVVDSD